jgi:hypothetical protein
MLSPMSFRPSQIVGIITLLVCVLCPIVELFDCWDHTEQTGNDTEYTLVVLGLCVGAAYALGRFLLNTRFVRHKVSRLLDNSVAPCAQAAIAFLYLPEIASSPPALSLRI